MIGLIFAFFILLGIGCFFAFVLAIKFLLDALDCMELTPDEAKNMSVEYENFRRNIHADSSNN